MGPSLQAAMIWSPSAPPGQQTYVAFRKNFTLPDEPGPATLHLFADSRYILWVNDSYVLRGPCRFDPKRPEYDSVDLRPFLRKGTNCLVVLAHHYAGAINGRIKQHVPGLTARLDVAGKELLRTDDSWRCSQNTEYRPSPGAWSSIPDALDARDKPAGWTGAAFDDSGWEKAAPFAATSWGALQPRAIPLLRETELTGMKLLPSGQAFAAAMPIELAAGKEVVLDLGRMAMAYAIVDLEAEEGSVLQIQYALRYVNGQPGETYGVGTTYTARKGRQRFIGGDQWCSHYMTVRCAAGHLTLHGLKMVDRHYPFERVGRFQSSDELLNRLWEMAINTIEAVTDDGYGSDARERDEWLQDPAQPNFLPTRIALAGPGPGGRPLYSDPRLLKNLLRHAALSQLPDGRIQATFPTDRHGDCHDFIDDYACQWVEALRLYYEATGDLAFLREMWPTLTRQLGWFLERRTPRGLVLARQYTSFDDPLAYITCEGAALNAFIYQALCDAAALGRVIGESAPAGDYGRAAADLAAAFNRLLWNAEEGTYNSGFSQEKVFGPTAHAALLALDRGLAPEDRRPSVRKWFLANYKRPGGFHCCTNPDFETMVAEKAGINMPVTYYWVFQELYRMDQLSMDLESQQEMRRRWARMVGESGDTGTLWEMFGGPESCHNYGAVPAYFLSAFVLGVRMDGPVSNHRLLIEPRLADLAFAEGVVVTEFGPVSVNWRKPAGGQGLDFKFVVPAGAKAAVRLPQVGGTPKLTLNGEPVKPRATPGRWISFEVEGGEYSGQLRP